MRPPIEGKFRQFDLCSKCGHRSSGKDYFIIFYNTLETKFGFIKSLGESLPSIT